MTQIEGVAIEGDAEFRLLRRRLPVVGIDLDELSGDVRASPHGFVQVPVQCDRFTWREALGRNGASCLGRRRRQLLGGNQFSDDENT